jgi:prophage antirepressor-like protein
MADFNSGASALVFPFTPSFAVRAVLIDGEPWFVAKDVAEALDYTWNGSARIEHVPEEWRGVTSVVTPSSQQDMAVLSEQGLYFFLGRSDKPKALPFQKWLAGEVLPAIRKTGRYESAAGKPAYEMLTVSDINRIAHVVGLMCGWFGHGQAMLQAVWFAIRQATGVPAPGRFGVHHLPTIVGELRRCYAIASGFNDAQRQAELMVIKRAIRNREAEGPILAQAQALMMQAAQKDEATAMALLSPWHERELQAVAQRLPICHDSVGRFGEGGL